MGGRRCDAQTNISRHEDGVVALFGRRELQPRPGHAMIYWYFLNCGTDEVSMSAFENGIVIVL